MLKAVFCEKYEKNFYLPVTEIPTRKKKRTRSRWRLKLLRAEAPPRSQHPTKFSGHKSCESEDINFSNCSLIWQDHLIEGHVTIWIGAHQGK